MRGRTPGMGKILVLPQESGGNEQQEQDTRARRSDA
jgi:hypothetical protein